MSSLNIAICGCGNGAHACAAMMSRKGHAVSIYSPFEEEVAVFKRNYGKNGGLDAEIVGELVTGLLLDKVSANPADVIPAADIIFIIVPAFAHKDIFHHIKKYMNPSALVAILPSRGLIELEIKEFLPDANVMAFQTLPWSCRMVEPGSQVNVKGIKKKIQIASHPSNLSAVFFHEMEALLDMRVERLESMLTLTLANMGQIFHPGIMYGLFKDDPFRTFSLEEIPLFYQGVTAEGAGILVGISEEVGQIGDALSASAAHVELDKILPPKQWLMESYCDVIEDKTSLQAMLNSNQAYHGIKVPVKKVGENCYRADFNCRYIIEDVPYSLLVTRSIGQMLRVKTPIMDEVIGKLGSWIGYPYLERCCEAAEFSNLSRLPVFYGMKTIADLNELYKLQTN